MYKVLNDIQLTKNFKLSEFECHDGEHEVMLDMELALKLQSLRDALAQSITIAAGYRNPVHNIAVGGSPNSRHLKGEAADVKTSRPPRVLALIAERLGFNGIGVYTHNGNSFVHLDVREKKSVWHDNPKTKNLTAVKTVTEVPA